MERVRVLEEQNKDKDKKIAELFALVGSKAQPIGDPIAKKRKENCTTSGASR